MRCFSAKAKRERQNFIAVAQREFLLRGFEKTTIKDLTDQMDLTKGAFFYYFKSKEEILVAVCEKLIEGEVEKLKSICESHEQPVAVRIRSFFRVLLETFAENKTLWRHIIQDTILHKQVFTTVRAEITPFLVALIEEGKSSKLFDVPCPAEIAETILTLIDLYVCQYSSATDKVRQERAFFAMEHVIGLILGEKCRPIYSGKF